MIFDIFNSFIEGIAITIIINIGVFFLGRLKSIINQLKIWRLKQFFGESAKYPDRINLIIPVLHPREEEIDRKVEYNHKNSSDNEIKTWWGPENVMAVEDVQAAASLISLLKPLTPKSIEPIKDEDLLDDWERCLICIGSPLSNSKAKLLMNDLKPPVVSWVKTPNDRYNQLLRLKSEKIDKDFTSSQTEDYGLILKIENKHSKGDFAFIIGGITHFGTIGAARYLKENWKKLNNKADRNPFICMIKVDKRKDLKRVEEVYFETIEKSF